MALKSKAFSTYLGLGQAYFNMQRYESCIDALNQGEQFLATEKEPEKEKYKLLQLRGYAYYQLQKFNEAVNDLQAAIRISSAEWADYSQLGIAFYNLKRDDEAIQALLKALAMKPGHTVTAEYLAKAYFRKGVAALSAKQYDQALDFLRKARDYNPKDGFVYYNMAEALHLPEELRRSRKIAQPGAGDDAEKRRGVSAAGVGLREAEKMGPGFELLPEGLRIEPVARGSRRRSIASTSSRSDSVFSYSETSRAFFLHPRVDGPPLRAQAHLDTTG